MGSTNQGMSARDFGALSFHSHAPPRDYVFITDLECPDYGAEGLVVRRTSDAHTIEIEGSRFPRTRAADIAVEVEGRHVHCKEVSSNLEPIAVASREHARTKDGWEKLQSTIRTARRAGHSDAAIVEAAARLLSP